MGEKASFSSLSDRVRKGQKERQKQDKGVGLVLSTLCFTLFQTELIKCVFMGGELSLLLMLQLRDGPIVRICPTVLNIL